MYKVEWAELWRNTFGEIARLLALSDGSAIVIDPQGYEHPFPDYDRAEEKLVYLGYC